MRGPRRMAAACAALALLLPLAGCGKYGKPVRKGRALAPSFAAEASGAHLEVPGAAAGGAQEKKPGGR